MLLTIQHRYWNIILHPPFISFTVDRKPRVAFLEGNGELEFRDVVADIIFQLQDFYEVGFVAMRGEPTALGWYSDSCGGPTIT
jgi:hypothetical protein